METSIRILISMMWLSSGLTGCGPDENDPGTILVPIAIHLLLPTPPKEAFAAPAKGELAQTWHGRPYSCNNAPHASPRHNFEVTNEEVVTSTRAPEIIRQELAEAIETGAVSREDVGSSGFFDSSAHIGTWTLVELTPRIVSLTVELRAAAAGVPPDRFQRVLRDARRRLTNDGERIFYVRVTGGVRIPAYVLLENQRGQQGRLIEATPALRTEGIHAGTDYGVLELEDKVESDDATFTVAFRDDYYGTPGNPLLQFTFDATQTQVLSTISGTFSPRASAMNTDSNGDGFTIQDAFGILGTVMNIVQIVIAVAAL